MEKCSRKLFACIYYTDLKTSAAMQMMAEPNGQVICERILAADSEIKYSSYIASNGSRLGEAMKETIVGKEKLTIMVLPLHPSCDVVVLAASAESNLNSILSHAKLALQLPFPFVQRQH